MKKIPDNLQSILWSVPLGKLDFAKHQSYIIHQVLMFGNFDQIRWLFKTYPKSQVVDTFLRQPQKIYTKEALNYISKFILDLSGVRLPVDKYVNAIS